jgi:uncharacterized protein
MKSKYIFRSLLVLLVIFLFAAFFAIEKVLPYAGIKPFRRSGTEKPSDFGLKYENFTVQNDTVKILGYYIPNDTAKATLICTHGISANKERNINFAKKLHDIGYNVVLIDLRAHGTSGGNYCTFGYYEKYDLQKVVDFVLAKTSNPNIGIHGHSLGGAVALQTLEVEPRLKFGVVESTFTNFMDVSYEYSDDFTGIKSRLLCNYITEKSAAIAQFERYNINPEESCRHITVPVFMEHGTADEKIPFEMGQKNFAALASAEKYFYPIQNGSHSRVHADGGEAYWAAMTAFLEKMKKNKYP